MVYQDSNSRGFLGQYVQNGWFQDPLLKTIRYLENIHQKEAAQKLQFLTNVRKVIDNFEKKTLVRKVIPALVDVLKEASLSSAVLNNIFHILSKDKFITTTEFRLAIWPGLIALCKSKELPAQTLFLLLKHSELILKFVSSNEFGTNLLPLIQKSLECGVPKL